MSKHTDVLVVCCRETAVLWIRRKYTSRRHKACSESDHSE